MSREQTLCILMIAVVAVVIGVLAVALASGPPTPAEPVRQLPAPPPPPAPIDLTTPPPAPVEPSPEPESIDARVERVVLDGQDIADLLNLRLWKFRLTLPPDEYTVHVWSERWTRDATLPQVTLLASAHDFWSEPIPLMIKLPDARDGQRYVRIGQSVSRTKQAEPLRIESPMRTDTLDRQPIEPGQDVPLLAFKHDLSGRLLDGIRDVHPYHDVTIYIKMRVIPGPFVPLEVESLDAPPPDVPPDDETTPSNMNGL